MATETTEPTTDFRPMAIALGILVVGHLGLLVVVPPDPSWQALLAVEAGALVVLAGAELLSGLSVLAVARVALIYTILVASTWLVQSSTDSLVVAPLALLIGVALAAYGLYRYELVSLGLVEVPDE